ncbi:MAG TPA: integrase core domain-containing protein [Gammaproteobacteria bacterium]|nr:integrase core domain-containing protein [Gammaproteobacteria bacterium]
MGWKKTNAREEKLKFIGDWLKKESSFSDLCERYEISRKTGYKLTSRYEAWGEVAFDELSRIRHLHPNETAREIKAKLIEIKYRYPTWGPGKILDWLKINEPKTKWPSASTSGEILKRHGLVKPRKYRDRAARFSEPFSNCEHPNDVWSADFKGQFRLGNDRYCYPLTVTDNYSRYLLECEGLLSPNTENVIKRFKKVFYEYGLPKAIKTDNGQPFAGMGIGGLTRLSIWWLKLGIMPERIKPGHPEQNGRHERMHRTLKEATIAPAKSSLKLQQRSFDRFKQEYNNERPHAGIDRKRPWDIYKKSARVLPDKLPEINYADHFEVRRVRSNGEIKLQGKKYFVSELLYGEPIGLEPIDDGKVLVYFAKLKLGLIDIREDKIIRP